MAFNLCIVIFFNLRSELETLKLHTELDFLPKRRCIAITTDILAAILNLSLM